MNWDDENFSCPICHTQDYVPPGGNENSPVMIIGEEPGADEIQKGVPMVGAMGGVLRSELRLLGLDLNMFQLANLWFHPPHKKDHPLYKDCLNHSVEIIIKEAQNKKAILLIGSETVGFFCNKKVSSVSGLQVESTYLSVPIIYACVQPAVVWHGGGLGEVRSALTKFVKRLEIEEIL